ncbi:MAG: NAD-dependent epimerase/dehydratase family protein [Candidatus Helarchaeota archaeon]
MSKDILITGGAGFIGSHLCHYFTNENYNIYCIDNFDPYYNPNLKRKNIIGLKDKENFHLIEGDILDEAMLQNFFKDYNVDYIFHEAAQAGVRFSIKDPIKTHNVNLLGTTKLLEASLNSNIKKFIFGSSSSIYGIVKYLPFDEGHPKSPISPYGVSKLACEQVLKVYNEIYGLKYTSLRYFTVFGPRMRPDLAISIFTKRALQDLDIEIFGDGKKTRDFTHIDNIVLGNILAMEKGIGEYNIGGGERTSILDLAEDIIKLTKSKSKITFSENAKGDAFHTTADISKAKKELGYSPKINFHKGLELFIEYMKSILLKKPRY